MKEGYCPNESNSVFYIDHKKIPPGAGMKADHYHDFLEIYYFLGGKMNYFIGNKTYKVKKFDMIFIDKFTYHRTIYRENDVRERILISFYDDVLSTIDDIRVYDKLSHLFEIKKASFPAEFNKKLVDNFINRILPSYYKTGSPVSQMKARVLFLELLLEIVEAAEEGVLIEDTSDVSPAERRVTEVINYINSNYQGNITLNALSKHFYVSKYYLCHIFKDITGVSIIDFINKKRLAEAERMLKYSNLNITEISEAVGFNSVNHFIGLFKNNYSCTPRNFRDRLSGAE